MSDVSGIKRELGDDSKWHAAIDKVLAQIKLIDSPRFKIIQNKVACIRNFTAEEKERMRRNHSPSIGEWYPESLKNEIDKAKKVIEDRRITFSKPEYDSFFMRLSQCRGPLLLPEYYKHHASLGKELKKHGVQCNQLLDWDSHKGHIVLEKDVTEDDDRFYMGIVAHELGHAVTTYSDIIERYKIVLSETKDDDLVRAITEKEDNGASYWMDVSRDEGHVWRFIIELVADMYAIEWGYLCERKWLRNYRNGHNIFPGDITTWRSCKNWKGLKLRLNDDYFFEKVN